MNGRVYTRLNLVSQSRLPGGEDRCRHEKLATRFSEPVRSRWERGPGQRPNFGRTVKTMSEQHCA